MQTRKWEKGARKPLVHARAHRLLDASTKCQLSLSPKVWSPGWCLESGWRVWYHFWWSPRSSVDRALV